MLIEHVDKIVGLRRNLVLEDSRFPQELTTAFRGMENAGNPWGQPPSERLEWAKSLSFKVRTVEEVQAAGQLDQLEVLYWVGCAAAFDDRNQRVARAVATCLEAAGVSFAVLGQEENCTGDPARRMGNDYVFQILAGQNIETLNRYRMGERTIVTACPHCFNSIGNEYGQLGGSFTVRHHSEYLAGLVKDGRLILGEDGLRTARSRITTPATWPATTGSRPPPGTSWGRSRASSCGRWMRTVARRSAAAPAVDGCGWRRPPAPASTQRGPSRCWTPARRRWPPRAPSAW